MEDDTLETTDLTFSETEEALSLTDDIQSAPKDASNQVGPNIVKSLSAVARHYKVSQPAVSKWKKNGLPVEEDGSYNLTRIAAWRALRVAHEAASLEKVEGIDSEVLAEVKKELGRFRALAETYKMNRSDVFASAQAKMLALGEEILDSIKSKDLKKMHVRDKIKALKDITASVTSLYSSERIERGESRENISIIVQQIHEIKKAQREEEKREFAEWVEDRRTKKIRIPSHAIENLRDRARIFNANIDGLIFEDASNTSWEKKK